jgi:hypothetical protein
MYHTIRDDVSRVLTEIQSGDGLGLAAAGRLFPGHRGGRAVNPSTIFRWVTRGLTDPSGTVIRLEAARVGARWLTSSAAVGRFVGALTAASSPPTAHPTPPSTPSPADRRRASDHAAAALEAAGA